MIVISVTIILLRIGIWFTERTDDLKTSEILYGKIRINNHEYKDEIASARLQILGLMKECKVPGISVSVSKYGKIIWSEAFGYSNLEQRIQVSIDTKFRIHSISKLFTSSLTIKCYEENTLELDTDIQTYLPDFHQKNITIRHLASHRSGIRGYHDDNEAMLQKNYNSIYESLDMFKNDPLAFEPGKDFLYSGFGYSLLSAVLEKTNNKNFTFLMKEKIFDPLNMNDSEEAANIPDSIGEAKCYDNTTPYSQDGSLVVSPTNDFSFKRAAGGFVSTSQDLVKFGDAHIKSLKKGFLKDENIDLLFEPETMQAPIIGYGLGWMTAKDLHFRNVHFGFGAGSGGTSVLIVYPEQEISIAILSNLGHAKFPFNRLMNIANSFQYSPAKILFNVWLASILFLLLVLIYRKKKRKKHNKINF